MFYSLKTDGNVTGKRDFDMAQRTVNWNAQLKHENTSKSDRRANAVMFGFDFQVNAAIVLMIENIKEMTCLKIESSNEDIDLTLKDGSHILAQAKAVVNASCDFKNVRAKLKKSLQSLSDGASKVHAAKLILITNSPNPLNDENSRFIFFGHAHRPFKSLPDSSQRIINELLLQIEQHSSFDTDRFMIQVIPFETDIEAERYKCITTVIDDFVGLLELNSPGIVRKIHSVWKDCVFANGTKKDISLSKKSLIWPIVTIVTDISQTSDEDVEKIIGDVDAEVYDDVIQRYPSVINNCCDNFEFVTRVIADYAQYTPGCSTKEKLCLYIKSNWSAFESEFEIVEDDETRCALIKVILLNILRKRKKIDKIKQVVEL